MIFLGVIIYGLKLLKIGLSVLKSIIWTGITDLAEKITQPLGRLKMARDMCAEHSLKERPNRPSYIDESPRPVPVEGKQRGIVFKIHGLSLSFNVTFHDHRVVSRSAELKDFYVGRDGAVGKQF